MNAYLTVAVFWLAVWVLWLQWRVFWLKRSLRIAGTVNRAIVDAVGQLYLKDKGDEVLDSEVIQ